MKDNHPRNATVTSIHAKITKSEYQEIVDFLKDDSIARWLRSDSISQLIRTSISKHIQEVRDSESDKRAAKSTH